MTDSHNPTPQYTFQMVLREQIFSIELAICCHDFDFDPTDEENKSMYKNAEENIKWYCAINDCLPKKKQTFWLIYNDDNDKDLGQIDEEPLYDFDTKSVFISMELEG